MPFEKLKQIFNSNRQSPSDANGVDAEQENNQISNPYNVSRVWHIYRNEKGEYVGAPPAWLEILHKDLR